MQVLKLQANQVSDIVTSGPIKLSPTQKIIIKALSGTIGAAISTVSLYPIENIKTRMMLE